MNMKKRILTDEGKFKLSMLVFASLFVYALIAGEYAHLVTCVLAVWLTHKYYGLATSWKKAYENEKDASKRTISLQREIIEQLEDRIKRAKRKKPSYGIPKKKVTSKDKEEKSNDNEGTLRTTNG